MEQKKEQTIYKRRLSSTIPYGWKLVEGSTDLLEEVPLELAYLDTGNDIAFLIPKKKLKSATPMHYRTNKELDILEREE